MKKIFTTLILSTAILLMPGTVLATGHCFEEAAARYSKFNVTPRLLYAIEKHESNFRADAVSPANWDGSRDFSAMQINTRWIPVLNKMGITPQALLKDACLSEKVGAWILAQCFIRYGVPSDKDILKYWTAVGAYNAGFGSKPNNHRSRMIYANAIYKNLVAMQ
jgi:soluble lytic murein transglycosylase-like protein